MKKDRQLPIELEIQGLDSFHPDDRHHCKYREWYENALPRIRSLEITLIDRTIEAAMFKMKCGDAEDPRWPEMNKRCLGEVIKLPAQPFKMADLPPLTYEQAQEVLAQPIPEGENR